MAWLADLFHMVVCGRCALNSEVEAQEAAVTVQDTCLLSMLRIAAECDEIPHTIPRLVTEISHFSGTRIRNVSSVAVWSRA